MAPAEIKGRIERGHPGRPRAEVEGSEAHYSAVGGRPGLRRKRAGIEQHQMIYALFPRRDGHTRRFMPWRSRRRLRPKRRAIRGVSQDHSQGPSRDPGGP